MAASIAALTSATLATAPPRGRTRLGVLPRFAPIIRLGGARIPAPPTACRLSPRFRLIDGEPPMITFDPHGGRTLWPSRAERCSRQIQRTVPGSGCADPATELDRYPTGLDRLLRRRP